jgi:hypothetical protein
MLENGTFLWTKSVSMLNVSTSIAIDTVGNLFIPNFVSTNGSIVVGLFVVDGLTGDVRQ